jgi:hypothetical protein
LLESHPSRVLLGALSRNGYDISGYSLPFRYDGADNLTTIRNLTNIGYNANNQIARTGFAYDENGNPTLFDSVNYSYDYENRVVQVGTMGMAYRPDGKRAWKQPGGLATRTYYLYDGERVIFEFNPTNGFYQAYAYGANGLACSERVSTYRLYAFDPAGNLVHRLYPNTILSNSWFDSYGNLVYDDSITGGQVQPDSVGYQGQWGAYTDVENWAQFLRGDYYQPRWARWLTRRSAGTNEYASTVNPAAGWLVWAVEIGLRSSILTARVEVSPETLRWWTDLQSLIPVAGIPADVGAAVMALRERDYFGAGLAVAGVVTEGADFLRILRRGRELLGELPLQLHHFATNKHSKYTERFKAILQRFGLKLDLDDEWNKGKIPHRGRHAEGYHRWVAEQMERAAWEAQGDPEKFKELYDRYVKQPVRDNPLMVRKEWWER